MVNITKLISNGLSGVRLRTLGRFCVGVKSDKRDYKLLQKLEKTDISSIDKQVWFAPKDAASFKLVRVGKKSDPKFISEVMTYFDSEGKIIERLFRQGGINTKQRLYSYGDRSREIITRDFVQPKVAKDVNIPDALRNLGGSWRKRISELQIIEEYPTLAEFIAPKYEGKNPVRLFTKKTEFAQAADVDSVRKYTFTHSPINLGIQDSSYKKLISGTVYKDGKNVELKDVYKTDNLDLNLDDEFLKYRFVDPRSDEGMKLLTNYIIKQKGLEPLSIRVFPSSGSVTNTSLGHFYNGEVHYSSKLKHMESAEVVDTVAHEIEHAYQHAQIGRLGKGNTRYETEAEQLLPEIKDNEIKEAVKYAVARDVYPTENRVWSNPLYRDNYLEVKAREAGENAKNLYRKDEENYRFFDWFYI